jgi:hypothetical protein
VRIFHPLNSLFVGGANEQSIYSVMSMTEGYEQEITNAEKCSVSRFCIEDSGELFFAGDDSAACLLRSQCY